MRRRERRALRKPPAELNVTAFLNLMVVLVPFLLITAVFSRITILELDVPTRSQTQSSSQQQLNLEVIVRKTGITVSDNRGAISQIKDYNLQALSGMMQKIKQLEKQMYKHARDLDFEEAAKLRDEIHKIQKIGLGLVDKKAAS